MGIDHEFKKVPLPNKSGADVFALVDLASKVAGNSLLERGFRLIGIEPEQTTAIRLMAHSINRKPPSPDILSGYDPGWEHHFPLPESLHNPDFEYWWSGLKPEDSRRVMGRVLRRMEQLATPSETATYLTYHGWD